MVFIVVQWENEDTVSAVNEKQVVWQWRVTRRHSRGNIDWFKQLKEGSPFTKQQFLKFLVSMFHNVKNIRVC